MGIVNNFIGMKLLIAIPVVGIRQRQSNIKYVNNVLKVTFSKHNSVDIL